MLALLFYNPNMSPVLNPRFGSSSVPPATLGEKTEGRERENWERLQRSARRLVPQKKLGAKIKEVLSLSFIISKT
jgi:hypothetical protein